MTAVVVWVAVVGYIVGYIVTFRYTAYAIAYEYGEPDAFDVGMSLFISGLLCFFWPAVLFVRSGLAQRMLLSEPPRRRKERELEEREEHIAQLEREVGIR